MTNSAPLPQSKSIQPMSVTDLRAEIVRCQAELHYAILRHRKAWARMRQVKRELTGQNVDFIDNQRPWKLALGDVEWWRGEMTAQATTLRALYAALDHEPITINLRVT